MNLSLFIDNKPPEFQLSVFMFKVIVIDGRSQKIDSPATMSGVTYSDELN